MKLSATDAAADTEPAHPAPLEQAGDPRLRVASLQDLLAERRENVQEARRETDAVAQEMLGWHVAAIDAELERRRAS